jgi:integrase
MSKPRSVYENRYDVEEGCIIFIDNRTKSRFYKARVSLSSGGYVYRSLKTSNQQEAALKAYAIWKDIRKREILDIPIKDLPVAELYKIFLADKGSSLSPSRQKTYRRHIDLYFSEYFGDEAAIHISGDKLLGYYVWRRDYWKHNNARQMNERHRHIAKEPADTTIFNEVAAFNSVMKHAYETQRIAKRVRIPTDEGLQAGMYKRPSAATFTDAEMRKISYHLRNSYLRKSKDYISDRSRRGAVNCYCAFFILQSTGIRTQELYSLRFSDIEEEDYEYEDSKGVVARRKVYVIRVVETKARRKRFSHRYVIANPRFGHYIKRAYENNAPHNKPSDYVLNTGGKKIPTLYKPFNKVLDQLGLKQDKRSGYTRDLRHIRAWYITNLIQRQIPVATAATQAGTSIAVMQRWYLNFSTEKTAKLLLKGLYVPAEVVSLVELMKDEL